MTIPITVVKTFKSEIIDMIRKMAERNNNRLNLPVVKGQFIGSVSNRDALQDKAKMEAYVQSASFGQTAQPLRSNGAAIPFITA